MNVSRTSNLFALCLLPAMSAVHAANWTISPRVDVIETYTDNISLAQAGNSDDFITEVNPAISINGEGKRLKLRFDYRMQNLIYANNSNLDNTNHQLSTSGNAELVERFFFVDAAASISQQLISNTGVIGLDNLSGTGNRTDVYTYSVSPYLTHRFGGYVTSEVRYTFDRTEVGSGASDSDAHQFDVSLASGRRFTKFRWDLKYHNQQLDRGTSASDASYENATGNIRYGLHRKFDLLARGGYEHNDFDSAAANNVVTKNGTYWSGGFDWHPSKKFALEALYGSRNTSANLRLAPIERTSFELGWQDRDIGTNPGTSWNMNLTHRTRRSRWSAVYFEDTTTTQQLLREVVNAQLVFLGIPLFDASGQPITTPINVFSLTDDIFLRKRFQVSTELNTGKSNFGLSLFKEDREYQVIADDESSIGGNASWTWDFANRTKSTISAGWQKTDFRSLAREDKLWNINLGITRSIRRNVTGNINFRHLENDSDTAANSYDENRASVSLNISF